MLRIQAYPELYEEMLDEGDGGSDEAAASLESLGDADLLRLDWAGGQRTRLLKAMPLCSQSDLGPDRAIRLGCSPPCCATLLRIW